ncbi:MAG: RMD1 family protein, partial [Polyangiaceae bacterium]|nr:RMD1 family protein [Polyangiaceae bacterium]
MKLPFQDHEAVRVRAISVGERLDLRGLERTETLAIAPLMITAGNHGAAVLFRYGVVVLFDVAPVEEVSFLSYLKPLATDPHDKPETEDAILKIDTNAGERADNGVITLHALDVERIQLVADILARTVALAESEAAMQAVFEMVEPLAV